MTLFSEASNLIDRELGDWKVIKKRVKDGSDDSGAFSSCYEVENIKSKQKAFLKAFNYHYAQEATGNSNSADNLKRWIDSFTYERDLLVQCGEKRLSRVVIAIDSGEFKANPSDLIPVYYLIFEIADKSLKNVKEEDFYKLKWKLKVFHGVLVGISQLHKHLIFHQDIKPSNILLFNNDYSKICDLGRATQFGNSSGFDNGDIRYLPVEYAYSFSIEDYKTQKFAADFWMIGNLYCYIFFNTPYLALFLRFLDDSFKPMPYGGRYSGSFLEVLPYLINAHNKVLEEILNNMPSDISKQSVNLINSFCYPDILKRGKSAEKSKSYTQFSLQPYISELDRLSKTIVVREILD